MRVVIIGAGLGGLSCACHLVGRGHDVTIVEQGDQPGGRAGRRSIDGYGFDTGPTVLTMPALVDDAFHAAGSQLADHVSLRQLDPAYRAVFVDGSEIRVRAGRDAMSDEIARTCSAADAHAFDGFCHWLEALARLELPHFIDRNFDSPIDLLREMRALIRLVRLGGLRRLARVVDRRFEDERLRRLFTFQAMYAGLSPFEALALYGIITYMDTVAGVFFPDGGMHAIARGLADAAAASTAGAQFRYGSPVAAIVRARSGRVTGVALESGELIAADVVVANPDVPAVYRDLLQLAPPRVARRGHYSPSCVVWLVGARGSPPPTSEHHNIHFGEQWREAFDALLRTGTRMPDRSILVTVPSTSDPSMAPPGRTSLYVLEPVPNLDGRVEWTTERAKVRDDLLADLVRNGYPSDIEVERLTDPRDWQAQGMERGTPFALAHRFFQAGPFRPNNVDGQVPGLVLTGSGTVPGVGIPMVLISGKLAAERVEQQDWRR